MFPDQFCSKMFKVWRVVMFLFSIIATYHQVPTASLDSLDQWSPSKALLIPIPLDSTQLAVCGVDITALWPHGIDSWRRLSVALKSEVPNAKTILWPHLWEKNRYLCRKEFGDYTNLASEWKRCFFFSIWLKVLIGFKDVAKVIVLPQDDMSCVFPNYQWWQWCACWRWFSWFSYELGPQIPTNEDSNWSEVHEKCMRSADIRALS